MAAFVLISLALIVAGGLGALIAGGNSRMASALAVGGTVAGSLFGLGVSLRTLWAAGSFQWSGGWQVPGGSFSLSVDPLSASFLLPLFLLSPLCALYGGAYLKDEGERRSLGPHWFFFNGLVAAMALVLTAANAVLFLVAWEIMSLTSFFLVAFDRQSEEARRSAWVYLLACHLGGACLFALFLLAGETAGSLDFARFSPLASASPGAALALFLLALVGFGIKAGLFPMHVWLPDAHPAAPSHVSALMSGVMVKTGIYGLLRILSLLPPAPAWWGAMLAVLGILGALYGIALAAVQRDVKRCLAYSTVENVGIVFVGLGLGIYAAGLGLPELAALGFAGGLLHLWNHALFKGLMFFGAGSLLHGTGSANMDRMGGLLRRMPVAGTLLIGGSIAIAALPPFNGLVGEWVIYLGLLRSGVAMGALGGLFSFVLVALLGLTGALAVIVFTRLIGVALLGEPRTEGARKAHEPPRWMVRPMGVLLVFCLVLGMVPQAAGRLLTAPVAAMVPGTPDLPHELLEPLAVLGRWALLVALALAFLAWLTLRLRKARPVSEAATWGCGFAFPTARMAYTGEAFADLARQHLLPGPLRPGVSEEGQSGPFPSGGRVAHRFPDPMLGRAVQPLFDCAGSWCVRLRWLQQGKLHIYLLYIFVTCAALIAWSFLEGRGMV